jgi:hypothetical protein
VGEGGKGTEHPVDFLDSRTQSTIEKLTEDETKVQVFVVLST